MDFLNKLYDNDSFGIGLFIVISFLVVAFLVVLFFGKRDEKKRKLEATGELKPQNLETPKETQDTFKEVSPEIKVEVQPNIVNDVLPVEPINLEEVNNNVINNPINNIEVSPIIANNVVKPIEPLNFEEAPKEVISPIIKEEIEPIKLEEVKTVEPIRLEPTIFNEPKNEVPIIEPIKIDIPVTNIEKEEPVVNNQVEFIKPIIEEPKVIEPVKIDNYMVDESDNTEVDLPKVDFEALAKSISDELDELERDTKYEEPKVTPINEVKEKVTPQFSSVYVHKDNTEPLNKGVDLPKKIDLPTVKSEDIKPENYTI